MAEHMTVFGENYFLEFGGVKVPKDMRMDTEDFLSAARFKKCTQAIIKYLEDNNAKPKQLSKNVATFYYGFVGAYFYSSPQPTKYEPAIAWLVPMINKYCDDKTRKRIKTAMQNDIKGFEKIKADKGLTPVQKGYLADTKAAEPKIK